MAGLGHIAIGFAAGRHYSGRTPARPWKAMVAFAVLSLSPDLDVLGFRLGIPYAHALGHRGASHSLVAALALGLLSALLAWRAGFPFKRTAILATLVAASHGALDALTDGGLGVATFWPFSDARHFLPWEPLPVSPIGRGLISARGLRVMATELLLFLPFWLYAFWPRRRAAALSGSRGSGPGESPPPPRP